MIILCHHKFSQALDCISITSIPLAAHVGILLSANCRKFHPGSLVYMTLLMLRDYCGSSPYKSRIVRKNYSAPLLIVFALLFLPGLVLSFARLSIG